MAEKTNQDYNPVTAQVALSNTFAPDVSDEKELAEEAGVVNPAHVDYAEALGNYESRADVETLANRRARDNGVSFSDADFVRTSDASGTVTGADATKEEADKAAASKRSQAKATADAAEDANPSTKAPESDSDK